MDAQQQQQQRPPRKVAWGRVTIISIFLLLIVISAILWLIGNPGQWSSILPGLILTALGVVIALFQWLFPVQQSAPIERNASGSSAHTNTILQGNKAGTQPLTGPLSPVLPVSRATHRSLIGVPPPTDARTIEQREKSVKEVYARLLRFDITAVVLTGIGGVGKSTLAALIYRHAEEQRAAGKGPFKAASLWLKIDSSAVTMSDLIGTIFEALGKPLPGGAQPDIDSQAPHSQAAMLFNALNETTAPRLIVLDQFENLLDWQTGAALADHVGVGEWIDVMNSQPCACRILLTSRPWPQGTRSYPPTYMQEYPVAGLEEQEGTDLLRKLGIQASVEELRQAVERCAGHVFALTLLTSLLRNRHLSLKAFFADPSYAQLWSGNVARNLLDQIYVEQLDPIQRQLLVAFCVYREPVPLEAARAIIVNERVVPVARWHQALDALLAQHLLQPAGEGLFQLHTIVVGFANDRFDEDDEANARELRVAYARAAEYYRRYASHYCPPREQRKNPGDVHALVEATWAMCQAEMWREAYELLEQERLYTDLRRWGSSAMLLELYQLLLPLQKWQPEAIIAARIYNDLGEIYGRVLGQMDRARKYFEQALELSRETGVLYEEGRALNNIGRACADTGDLRQSLLFYEEALAIYNKENDLYGRGQVLRNVGWAYYNLALLDRALEAFEETLTIYRQLGERGEEARALNSIGRVHLNRGETQEALRWHKQALQIVRVIGDLSTEGWTLNCLGRVYEAMGKDVLGTDKNKAREYRLEAVEYLKQALEIRRKIGNRKSEGSVLNNLGVSYAHLGDKQKALEYYEKALVVRREVDDQSGEAKTQVWLAWLYRDMGEIERSVAYFKQALKIRRETGQRKHEAKTLSWLGLCCVEAGHNELALASLLLSLELFAHLDDPDEDAERRAQIARGTLETLKQKLGEQPFTEMRAQVEPRASEIIEEALPC